MLHAPFIMEQYGHEDLCHMFRLVSLNPAKAVMMDNEIGSLATGKRADILLIEKLDDGFPVITSVFVNGEYIFQTHYRR
jgi:alpha-D-ribose 1-methylphosphonate 5-triphosphate diphosphatase